MLRDNNCNSLHNITTEDKVIVFLMALGFRQEKIASMLRLESDIYGRTRTILRGKTKLNGSLGPSPSQIEALPSVARKQLHYSVNSYLQLPHPDVVTPNQISLNLDSVMAFFLGDKLLIALKDALPDVTIVIKINDSSSIQNDLYDDGCCGCIYPPNHKTLKNSHRDNIGLTLTEVDRVLSAHPDNPVFNESIQTIEDLKEYKFTSINAPELEHTDLFQYLINTGLSGRQAREMFTNPIECVERARVNIRQNNEILACNRAVMRRLGATPLLNNSLQKKIFKTPELNEIRYEFGRTSSAAKYWPIIARVAIQLFNKEKNAY